jgi:hypothetical protein
MFTELIVLAKSSSMATVAGAVKTEFVRFVTFAYSAGLVKKVVTIAVCVAALPPRLNKLSVNGDVEVLAICSRNELSTVKFTPSSPNLDDQILIVA